MAFALCELIQGAGVIGQAGVLPDFLALGAEIIENDDLFALAVKRMKEASRGASPRGEGRAGR